MKDEIKETLEDIKRPLDYVEATKQASIRDNEMKVMYDYITNLQNTIKDNEDTITDKKECIFALETTLTNLQEENERLKEIRNQAIDYNKALCKIYDCGIELSNAETNLCILKDEETINLLQRKSDE